jgi:3-hydroxybutyryl-CoA dehydrogenase
MTELTGRPVAVIGLGVMGRGIARIFTLAGAQVRATDATPELLDRNGQLLTEEIEADGDHQAPQLAADLRECVVGAEIVVEAVSEDPTAKGELLRELAELVSPSSLVASNTSSLSISDLGLQFGRPEQLVGMHFFNPATKMRLVEVVAGAQTDREAVGEALAIARALGKEPVLCMDSPGFIVNRICRPLYYEGQLLAMQQVEPAAVDALARLALGHRLGPLETIDLAGLHTHLIASETALREFGDPRYRPIPIVRQYVRSRWLGRSTGRGFYDYGRETPGKARTRVVQEASSDQGPVAGTLEGPDEARVERLLQEHGRTVDGDRSLIIYCAADPSPADFERVAQLAQDGPVVVESSHGRWVRELPADVGWLRLHASPTGLIAEVVVDGEAGVGRTGALDTLLAQCGAAAVEVPALPGLIVDRLAFSLINEAGSVVEEGTAAAEDVDTALTLGMNHAQGPFALADRYGLSEVVAGLEGMQQMTGDPRYRPAQLLIRRAAGRARVTSGSNSESL